MRRADGFTLLEIAIAIFIMVVLLMISVPSMNGVLADRRLRRSLDDVNRLVNQAHERSVNEGRSYLVVWMKEGPALRPEAWIEGEERKPLATIRLRKGESFGFNLPASLEDEPPGQWVFWPSGNCEPAVVTYRGPDGGWTVTYSALTERPQIDKYVVR
jgi:prepilin-type N-terminal cleavage/methylation domain-containing protein